MGESDIFEILNRQLPNNRLAMAAVPFMDISYDDFVDLLYTEIQRHIEKLECDAEQLQSLDEDSITGNIIRMLNAGQTFKASAQTYQGGTVDLTVEFQQHRWIAEAKKLTSNEKVFEGLLQLLTRYVKRDPQAGLLIYVLTGNFSNRKNDWKTYLSKGGGWERYVNERKEEEYREDLNQLISGNSFTANEPYYFDSEIPLKRGTLLKVRHFFCDFVCQPMDKSGTQAKKHRQGQALNMLEAIFEQSVAVDSVPLDIQAVEKALSLLFRKVEK
ncbi:TPA: hypothetical protein ACX6SM_002932 [Photobacterium damselae]